MVFVYRALCPLASYCCDVQVSCQDPTNVTSYQAFDDDFLNRSTDIVRDLLI